MKLVTIETTVKYQGKRYYPNVPFDLDVNEIPEELKGVVKEYVENEQEQKQFQSNRKNRDGLLKRDTSEKKSRAKNSSSNKRMNKEAQNDDLLNVGLDFEALSK